MDPFALQILLEFDCFTSDRLFAFSLVLESQLSDQNFMHLLLSNLADVLADWELNDGILGHTPNTSMQVLSEPVRDAWIIAQVD